MVDFSFDDPMAAFQRGYQGVNVMRQDIAKRQAGKAYAGGDISGAANIFARAGDVDSARTIHNDQQAQAKARLEVLGNVSKGLRGLPMEARPAAYQQASATLRQLGFPDAAIAEAGQHLDDNSLETTMSTAGQELERMKVMSTEGGGVIAFDPRNPSATVNVLAKPRNRVSMGYEEQEDGTWSPIDPLIPQVKQAQIGAINARAGASGASAEAARARAARSRAGGGGHGGGARSGGGGNPVLDAIAAELRRRGKL